MVTPDPPPGTGTRRRAWPYLAAGLVLALVVGLVLFGSIGFGSRATGTDTSATSPAEPGVNAATVKLLSLITVPDANVRAAPEFHLTDQRGRPVSLAALRGKVVVFSANDDQCTDVCTLLANDIIVANRDLGAAAKDVVWVSVNANPYYPSVAAVRAWSVEHGLEKLANWHFGTAAPATLEKVWGSYDITVAQDAKTRTVDHSDYLYFIDPSGHERAVASFSTAAASTSLFAHAVAQLADDLLPRSEQVHVAGPVVASASSGTPTVGAVAPALSLPYLRGGRGTFDLRADRGHYVVLNFWSSTCAACRSELPAVESVHRFAGTKVDFVGVDVSDLSTRNALALARRAGVTYPLVSDRSGTAAGAEQLTATPYTVIVGPDGRILVRHPGAFTAEQLKYVLQSEDMALPSGS